MVFVGKQHFYCLLAVKQKDRRNSGKLSPVFYGKKFLNRSAAFYLWRHSQTIDL